MIPITPDLQQNIFITIYLLFSHNYIVIAYFVGFLISIALALYRPSRFAALVLLGFAVLLFSYEYDKHIIEGLRQQTLTSLVTAEPHFKLQRLINVVISELLPVFFYILGWGLLFTAIFKAGIKISKPKKD